MSMLDILIRKSYSEILDPAVVLTRYSNDTSLHSCINVFTEGTTDEIFYNRFIEKYYKHSRIKYWVCGKKENVQEVLLLFKDQSEQWQSTKSKYNRNKLLFIIDRDFVFDHNKGFDNEQLRKDKADTYENVFNTGLHSFENYLVSEETFRFLITKAFNISDTGAILELENQFKNQYKCFIAFHLFCYAWLEVFLNGQPRNILENGIYDNSLFLNPNLELEIKTQLIKDKSINFTAISKILFQCLRFKEREFFNRKSNAEKIEFQKQVRERHAGLIKLTDIEIKKYIRGKDDLWFFIWFYNQIKKRSYKEFLKKYRVDLSSLDKDRQRIAKRNIKLLRERYINLNGKNALYILTHQISIPKELDDFLKINSNKLKTKKEIDQKQGKQ